MDDDWFVFLSIDLSEFILGDVYVAFGGDLKGGCCVLTIVWFGEFTWNLDVDCGGTGGGGMKAVSEFASNVSAGFEGTSLFTFV